MNTESPTVLPNSKAIQFAENQTLPIIADWDEITWSIADAGPIHGVVLVERARTFGSKLIDLRWNIDRLKAGAITIGFAVESTVAWYEKVCQLLLDANANILEARDVSLVVLFSPMELEGRLGWKSIAYLSPIPYARLRNSYQIGCPLRTGTIGIVGNSVFPSSIKHRSRIHYWLADRHSRETNPQSVAVLMDQEKRLGDCSVANLIFVDHQQNWFTPDREHSHHGTTLKQTQVLLKAHGTTMEERPVSYDEAIACQEVILVGSTGVVWPASSIDETNFPNSRIHCERLQSLWIKYLGFDFTSVTH